MTSREETDHKSQLAALRDHWVSWLADAAYPRWATYGIDPQNNGFIETLGQNGIGLPHPRRARVHPRQLYSFAQAPAFGWAGDAPGILLRGLAYFTTFYRRPDGLFRTLAAVDGAPLDERALLYDQAFALLGYAAMAKTLGSVDEYERLALDLRVSIERGLRGSDGAFRSADDADRHRESNPHMHLLESCLAWSEIGTDPGWDTWVANLVDLALTRFIRRGSGSLGENFLRDWRPAPGTAGRIVEPGHQFEWAWLLLRAEGRHPSALRDTALTLIDIGETRGVHNGVAVNALLDDGSLHDANARFWPQTERLKAALFAARLTGDARYWAMAARAASSMLPYIKTRVAGLWFDVQLPSGELLDSPAPASTLYHLVGAIAALDEAMT